MPALPAALGGLSTKTSQRSRHAASPPCPCIPRWRLRARGRSVGLGHMAAACSSASAASLASIRNGLLGCAASCRGWRSVSSLRTSRRLSRVDNGPCSACRASVITAGCGRYLSYGCEFSAPHSRHPASPPPARHAIAPIGSAPQHGRERRLDVSGQSEETQPLSPHCHRCGG